MGYKKQFRMGDKFSDWELLEFINAGGNGEVWKTKDKDNDDCAIKILKKPSKNSYQRFCDEIQAVSKNSDIQGILPIIDFSLPEYSASDRPWYVMPYAISLDKYIRDKTLNEIIDLLINLSESLSMLHQRKVFHRDIKPANLFFYDGTPRFGDFGIVDYPDKADLTRNRESIGSKWTISPEMKRNAQTADGEMADAYSFSKTIWMLLTGDKLSFDGQYISNSSIAISKYLNRVYTKTLDDLLTTCTDNDPNKRFNLRQITQTLKDWKETNNSYQKRNKEEWDEVQGILFSRSIPERVIWSSIEDIIYVLNVLSKSDSLNHLFFPYGGGLDLVGARFSVENNCIELNTSGIICVLKPKRLLFESFMPYSSWSYFRLETEALDSVSEQETKHSGAEELTEITNGQYTDPNCYDFNNYNGESLPDTSRKIVRILRGDIVIFSKTSVYNNNQDTYDGRHNLMSADDFRAYISKSISQIEAKDDHDDKNETVISYSKDKAIRKGRSLTDSEITLIEKVINVSLEAGDEDRKIKEKYGFNDTRFINISDSNVLDYMFERNEAEDKLSDLLGAFSEDEIILVASVMYAGRDYLTSRKCLSLEEMHDRFSSMLGLRELIKEKAPLAEYLRNGIRAYQ